MGHADTPAEQDGQREVSPLLHLVAPIVAIGATWAVRKMLNSGYKKVTGNQPPAPHDMQRSFASAVVWAAATAATAAVVEVAVYRFTSQGGVKR